MRGFLVSFALLALATADIANFARYGTNVGDTIAYRCDDCYYGPTVFPFTFYGSLRSTAYVNNNGLISFDQGNAEYSPYGMSVATFPAVAGYWYDVDTRPSNGGYVYYRATTDATDLAAASARVSSSFHGTRMFIATWDSVGVYSYNVGQLQTFQIVLIADDNGNSWALLNYGQLQRAYAAIGVTNGDRTNYVEAPESRTETSNQTPDRIFQVNAAVVVIPSSICGNGIVEASEQCDGDACCASDCTFASASTVCRGSAGECDAAETCTGDSASCPADSLLGSSTVCRASAGACDVAETCTGASVSCPANAVAASSVVCRAAANACDVAEKCTGISTVCPVDVLSNSTSCFCARQNLNNGEMGYYCTVNGGYYQCLGGAYAAQSRAMKCGSGTQCACSYGTECSCGQTRSPCLRPTDPNTC